VLTSWMTPGIILMDEPEAALSPQRQLSLLASMMSLARGGRVQFVIATHSAILLTFPDAHILSFDGPTIARTRLEDTAHYQITRGILESPERYWKHLVDDPDTD
jgi:predicted ATPase